MPRADDACLTALPRRGRNDTGATKLKITIRASATIGASSTPGAGVGYRGRSSTSAAMRGTILAAEPPGNPLCHDGDAPAVTYEFTRVQRACSHSHLARCGRLVPDPLASSLGFRR
jgi:hypothetical protein